MIRSLPTAKDQCCRIQLHKSMAVCHCTDKTTPQGKVYMKRKACNIKLVNLKNNDVEYEPGAHGCGA